MSNKLYEDTTFLDSEYPSSTKLQSFNSNVSAGLDLLAKAIAQLGGDDRVIDNPETADELQVLASSPVDLQVHVQVGIACISETVCQNESITHLAIVAPTTSNRYTIVQISNEGVIDTKDGAEAGSPSEPNADTDYIKLAAIYLRQNSTEIYDTDQGSEAYIIDRRDIFALHPTTIPRHKDITIIGAVATAGGPNSDGYFYGTSSSGFTFGKAVTIEKGAINALVAPVGADLIITIRNITQVTSDTITLTDGESFEEDPSVDINFAADDELALQVTQVGSGTAGSDLDISLEYVLQ